MQGSKVIDWITLHKEETLIYFGIFMCVYIILRLMLHRSPRRRILLLTLGLRILRDSVLLLEGSEKLLAELFGDRKCNLAVDRLALLSDLVGAIGWHGDEKLVGVTPFDDCDVADKDTVCECHGGKCLDLTVVAFYFIDFDVVFHIFTRFLSVYADCATEAGAVLKNDI